MKVRTGFVSNSSSSSFLIYGVCINSGEAAAKFDIDTSSDGEYLEDLERALNEALKGTGLTTILDYENYRFFIGKSWDKVGDNETGKQFKDKIEQVVAEKLGTTRKPKTQNITIEG